ncbi:MAG: xanthine dehydrogenase family protein molybdopterin-binding subunit, partial [Hyphomicrobiales bacterium]|nr:xanthine dehydrogenase family protein molybdopterin-binding subunit [Hyphomicrobiales bacterium]
MTKLPEKFGMGAPVRRLEDAALLTGRGRFVADLTPPGTLHAAVLRSPVAHADFRIIDADAAREFPGVHLVLTGDDIADIGPLPCRARPPQADGSEYFVPHRPALAQGRVRHVGEPVAFIVADSVDIAKSAAELVEIDWSPLPVAVGTGRALDPETPVLWPERGSNLAFTIHHGDAAATDAAFSRATQIAEIEIVNNRVVTNYMEPRGVVAEYDATADKVTMTAGSQGVHSMRAVIAEMFDLPAEGVRVVTPDVGGGFG